MSYSHRQYESMTGFTLVELLIVIVVVAILAITVFVSYTGISQRSHTSASQSAAKDVAQKIEMYHVANSQYPNLPFQIDDLTPDDVSYVNRDIKILAGNFSTYQPTDHEVGVLHCSADGSNMGDIVGVKVFWYNYTQKQSHHFTLGQCSS